MAFAVILFTACNSSEETIPNNETSEITPEIVSKLQAAYFETSSAKVTTFMGEKGVAVEDMFFTFAQIDELGEGSNIPNTEHYRTTNLVTGLPRVITVSVSPDLGTLGSDALDKTIVMLNNLGSQLTYQRVSYGGKGKSKADIEVNEFYELESGGFITLGRAAGFPTRRGDPAKGFGINSRWFELSIAPTSSELAGTMAHEIGHCIGFRHTDYQTRESCGQNVNEGSAGVGAIHIAGTPTGSDNTSIMQSCGPAITFNNNDKNAMLTLY
ncbi:protease B [Tenacibaculum discolor]|uniref:M57 family metalloprotease n=1 Tax=Tenacibaculum discolor TaxID=361581 RepID=A0A2G1BUF8_9FLAO|nr:M57 family metalloprotease [Tenacibaculum discolor]MDP2541898.1 M57 family metalloprotease [Tenacibaculum discolor]PHN97681.1 protease B [Tenacibaculum discolor]